MAKSLVSAVKLADYGNFPQVQSALHDLLAPLGGMEHFVHPGQKVLLKVNLLSPSAPDKAVTTHPAIVRAVLQCVKSCGGICFVGDGPGVGDTRTAAAASGILDVVRSGGATLLEFQETAVFENLDNRICKRLSLARQLQEMDVVITLPKLKTHSQMGFTGALKNQFGLVPGSAKGQFHLRFQNRDRLADLMIDINRTIRPVLAIMDAVLSMEGPGPGSGFPRKTGFLLASEDLVAIDSVACAAIHLPLSEVPLSQAAIRAHFGNHDLTDIQLTLPLEQFQVPDFKHAGTPLNIMKVLPLPRWILQWVRRQFIPAPYINAKKCIHCGRCQTGCPVTPAAITPNATQGPLLHHNRCIRCYCCHEFCPVKAIILKKSLLARLLPLTPLANFGTKIAGKLKRLFK